MDVGGWLRGLGLGQYEEKFRDNKIDADLLPRLTVDDLKDIGVSVVGDRRRLLDAIAVIAGAGRPADLPASPTKSAPSKGLQASAERRPITVMFCDLVGSTSLAAKLDAEDWRNLVNAYLDQASAAVTGFGGHVLKRLGDGLMALFGYPQAQENDAERALRAALAIQRALAELNARNTSKGAPELAARIGLESGLVVVDATGEVFGEAPNVAARVQAAAEPGSVLVTGSVQRQVAGLFVVEEKGAHDLKGVTAPVALYRVVRASGGGRRAGARALTPLVGREDELALLTRRWSRALEGEGQFVQIVGEPGIGKSRLIEEFRAKLAETPHTWAEWAASQLLQNTPLHPLAEWGRLRFGGADATDEGRRADLENTLRLVGLDPDEYAPLIAPLVDIPLPEERSAKFPPEELRRRQLAAVTAWYFAGARTQPAVLVFEDLHWADPTSLDLLRSLVERGAQAPLLIVATTRPEFRPPWAMRSHHGAVSLAPLDRTEVRRMVGGIASRHALSDEMIDGVGERSGGVPLFVEEVTRLLLERDAQGGTQAIPPTLQQSLAARLDRLGEAREVAQIGAVLGRDFSYRLLRDLSSTAAGFDEPRLHAALDRLTEADLLFVDGAPPTASYRFKHALIQDAAYESLLKSRRQALHRRAADALVAAAAEPEAIAHHFTQAGLDDLAIEWWGKAGDQALRRSAFQEAVAHLGRAIAMADKGAVESVPPATISDTKPSGRVRLQADYAQAVMYSKGFAADETKAAFERTGDLATQAEFPGGRFPALYGQFVWCLFRGEPRTGRDIAQLFLREAEAQGGVAETAVAHRLMGLACAYCGDLAEARRELELAIDSHGRERDSEVIDKFGQDTGVAGRAYLALVSWLMGDFHRARQCIQEATHLSGELDHLPSGIVALGYKVIVESAQNDLESILVDGENLLKISQQHGMDFYGALCRVYLSWARGRLGDARSGADELRNSLAEYTGQGNGLAMPWFLGFLAELEAVAGDFEPGLAAISEGLASAQDGGQHYVDAFLHRLRGDILLKHNPADPAAAEYAYQTAIAIAQQQGGRSYKLLASLALAKLYQSTGRLVEAHAVLAPALEGFSPPPELPEIAEAQALVAALSETEEVQVIAQQQRRAQLHVAYGNALFASRGYAAPETTGAFTRARDSASGRKEAPERLAADWGLWAGSFVRGDLSSMEVHTATFLSDLEARPDSPEAGIAQRAAGLTRWFAGEYVEARGHLERALALFQPGRDDDLAFRFGLDPGVAAMASLAVALWPLGEIDRAISLVHGAQERSANISHIGTQAYAKMYAAMFHLMLNDHGPPAAQNSFELAQIALQSDLTLSRAFAVFLQGWGNYQSGAFADGIREMRCGVIDLHRQNILYFDGLLNVTLAKAEAGAGDPDQAVAILDEALATSDRLGYRAFEAELHRVRGEILLKRDPANPAPVEEAFLAGVAVAKQQGTRSFELRAALSLAKLYQSTDRPAEAHAVLAPALEGFSPTPEMPEIAEAQALLAALADSAEVKAAEAQRERRLHLQTAYGQALMYSRGYASDESKIAFARARTLAAGVRDASERFDAYYGLFVGSLLGGELSLARDTAESFLREAETEGWMTEAAIARRCVGLARLWQGDLIGAEANLVEALRIYDPVRDRDAKFRFTSDTGVAAAVYLALASWALGDVERARALSDEALARADETPHAPTHASVHHFISLYHVLRGDPETVSRTAKIPVDLGREHGMALWLAFGEVQSNWARARLGDRESGMTGVREASAALRGQGNKLFAPLFQGLLAELEAEGDDADGALRRIDEALALANETGEHWTDALLHRIRGAILLKRNPASPAPAEEAFLTAIAIGQTQKARSFELQAALALAKLYQSTGRAADAHAVLVPALQGFTPTPEMPEIAEAQALLVAIEAGAHVRHE